MIPVLQCERLSVRYPDGTIPIRDVSFSVAKGECFALVGGSGAGKSTIARALLGMHGRKTKISGTLTIGEQNMAQANASEWRQKRGRDIGFVAQNPWDSCDPLRVVGDHVAEAWRSHGLSVDWTTIAQRLDTLDIPEATDKMRRHPHTWSGGMLQRASIAAASALSPPVLVADEPTSALDADRAQKVLDALRAVGVAVVLISHDIELVLRNADRIGVLHDGHLVETGTPSTLRKYAQHPQTKRLLGALSPFPKRQSPTKHDTILKLTDVSVQYERGKIQALAPTSIEISAGEIVGVQGPSGCGKSTLLRLVMGLETPSSGQVWRADMLKRAGSVLPIFQDPIGSLVPHWPIWRSIAEPLRGQGMPKISSEDCRQKAIAALHSVGLGQIDPLARPSELSVGQCQRIAIARAMITQPKLIVADEPTSALDSISVQKVGALLSAASDRGAAVPIVCHDRGFLERIADRVVTLNNHSS